MTAFFNKITSKDIRNILAVITFLGSFAILTLLIFVPIPEGNKDVLNVSIGIVLGGALGGAAGYYFGASKGPSTAVKREEE